jgi:hypothetical protein
MKKRKLIMFSAMEKYRVTTKSNKAFKASGSDTRVLSINVRAAALTWCWESIIQFIMVFL